MNLKQIRVIKGFMSSYVAKQLGISHRQFNRIESGEGYLTEERVELLAKVYKVKTSEIREGAKVEC